MTAKQPAKGGARKRPAAQLAGAASVDPAIVAAVVAALQQTGFIAGANIAPPADPPAPAPEEPEDAEADREIAASQAKIAADQNRIEQLISEALPLMFQDRHMLVLRWIASSSGNSIGRVVQQILRAEVSRQMPTYREAIGGGGSSSRNIELLTERLPVHK